MTTRIVVQIGKGTRKALLERFEVVRIDRPRLTWRGWLRELIASQVLHVTRNQGT